jgi:hypothetical protein
MGSALKPEHDQRSSVDEAGHGVIRASEQPDDEAQISSGEHHLLWFATRPFVIGH